LLANVGTLEFRILANRRDHPSLIEQAQNESETDRIEADGTLLGWWVPVAPGKENGLNYPEIITRTRKTGDRETLEVLVAKASGRNKSTTRWHLAGPVGPVCWQPLSSTNSIVMVAKTMSTRFLQAMAFRRNSGGGL